MGVHGLTGYVNKQTSLSTTLILPNPQSSTPDPSTPLSRIPFVIDGLALIYHLGLLDPLRGGNYVELGNIVRRYISWYRACGLEPEFVWDGPFDVSKLPTVISRSSQSLQRTITYMKSGDGARMQGPLKKAASRLPPLTHQVVSAVLDEMGVSSHCAEGEGDSPTAELAQQRNGFVVSNDSDYFIFNSDCRGYIPLHSITYGAANEPRLEKVSVTEAPRIQFLVYRHQDIAKHFNLRPPLLPIFAALLGNDLVDYADEIQLPKNARKRYFPGRVDPVEITRIGRALSQFSSLPAQTLPQIQDIVFAVLPSLLSKPSKDPSIITKLAASAYAYRLISITTPSPSFPLNPRSSDTPAQATSRALYHSTYKSSHLSSFLLHILKHRTVVLQGPLEMPEYKSPVIYLGRPLRQMIYSILSFVVGIDDSPTQSIIEYCRSGEQLHPTSIPILPLSPTYISLQYLPPPSSSSLLTTPPSFRYSLYLHLLRLPPDLQPSPIFPIIASLTHLILHCPSTRQWTTHQLLCATLTASLLLHSPSSLSSLPRPKEPPRKLDLHLTSELLTSLVWINTLGGSLLLSEKWKGINWKVYDGKGFHSLLGIKKEEEIWKIVKEMKREVGEEVRAVMDYLGQVRASVGID